MIPIYLFKKKKLNFRAKFHEGDGSPSWIKGFTFSMILCYPITNQRTDKKKWEARKRLMRFRKTYSWRDWLREQKKGKRVKCFKKMWERGSGGRLGMVCMPTTIYTIKSHFCPSFLFPFFSFPPFLHLCYFVR